MTQLHLCASYIHLNDLIFYRTFMKQLQFQLVLGKCLFKRCHVLFSGCAVSSAQRISDLAQSFQLIRKKHVGKCHTVYCLSSIFVPVPSFCTA